MQQELSGLGEASSRLQPQTFGTSEIRPRACERDGVTRPRGTGSAASPQPAARKLDGPWLCEEGRGGIGKILTTALLVAGGFAGFLCRRQAGRILMPDAAVRLVVEVELSGAQPSAQPSAARCSVFFG